MTQATNYYMISNRTYLGNNSFGTTVSPNGTLTFLSAPASNPTTFTVMEYADWLVAVREDLERCSKVDRPKGPPLVLPVWATLFIHGYGVTFEDATTVFPTYFTNLASAAGGSYRGVLIGLDWPSDDLLDKLHQAQAFQDAKANARTTADLSFPTETQSDGLPRLLQVLQQIKTTSVLLPVTLAAICHSMGNYLMFCGAGAFAPDAPLFDQILCCAAMLEVNGFNSPIKPPSQTPCADIVAAANRVTIYYSSHDDVLPAAQLKGFDDYKELGIHGPAYDATLLGGVIGVDCSAVVDKANAEKYEVGQTKILTHTSYFFIPEVLADIVQTVMGTPASDMKDRTVMQGTSVGFTMNAISSG